MSVGQVVWKHWQCYVPKGLKCVPNRGGWSRLKRQKIWCLGANQALHDAFWSNLSNSSNAFPNKAKRFAKQQRSNVQVLPCVYCYFLPAEQTALETKLQCSGELLTAADRYNYSRSPNTRIKHGKLALREENCNMLIKVSGLYQEFRVNMSM